MVFEALYYTDRVRIVNPAGDLGIATLWSQADSVHKVLEGAGVDLSPEAPPRSASAARTATSTAR